MSGWRAAVVALVVGGLVLAAGYLIPRLGSEEENGGDEQPVSGLALACDPALAVVCEEIAAVLEVEVARWSRAGEVPDRTVVVAPARDLPQAVTVGPAVAKSPIVIGMWRDRSQVLFARCGGIDLACVGDALGETWDGLGGSATWGDFKLALADPTRGEAGMLAWSVAADLGTRSTLERSLRHVAGSDAQLTADMVLFGDSRADAVITTEVALAGQLENAIGRGGRIEVFYPASSPWIEYVAAGEGRGTSGLIERLSSPEVVELMSEAGLRPAAGDAAVLPEGLGDAGSPEPSPDDATRARLVDEWEQLR